MSEDSKHGIRSEFNMGELDFQRYHDMLMFADNLAFKVRMFDVKSIQAYASILRGIYMNWKPMIYINFHGELDKKFEDVEREIAQLVKKTQYNPEYRPKVKLISDLTEIHEELLKFKQIIGLGTPLRKTIDSKHKLEKGLGG